MPIVLALDAGTGGAKCVAIDDTGTVRGLASQRWEYQVVANADVPIVKEYAFDPDEFWSIVAGCARRALENVDAAEVVGVVTTSQREGCVFIGEDGRELYAGPNLDSRGFMEGLEVLEKLGAPRLYEITGHSAPFIFPLVRYLWFRKNDGRRVRKVLMLNDWMVYRCCGAEVSEPSNATESMLFDFRERTWSSEILGLFDIDASILPVVATPGEVVGTMSANRARELGVPEATPVHVGGADTQCAMVGMGAVEAGDMAVTLGTTTPIQLVCGEPLLDPAENLWAGCHVMADRWVLEANAGSTGDAWEWFLGLLVGSGGDRYQRAETLMREVTLRGETVSFVGPRIFDLTKLRPEMPGAVFFPFPSFQLRPSPGQLLRSLLESVAFAVRANVEQIEAVGGIASSPLREGVGIASSPLRVGGGLSRSRLLVHMIADVTGRDVECARVADGTALGCAALVFAAGGVYPDVRAAARAMSQSDLVQPDERDPSVPPPAYDRWRNLYDSLDQLSL